MMFYLTDNRVLTSLDLPLTPLTLLCPARKLLVSELVQLLVMLLTKDSWILLLPVSTVKKVFVYVQLLTSRRM